MLYYPGTDEPYLATQADVDVGLAENVGDVARFKTQDEATQAQMNRINEILKDYIQFQPPVSTEFVTKKKQT